MKLDDETAFNALKEERDALKKELDELRKNIIIERHKSYDIESINDRMKNGSWLAVAVSFLITFVFGYFSINSLTPIESFSDKLGIIVGIWSSSWMVYYITWRLEFK